MNSDWLDFSQKPSDGPLNHGFDYSFILPASLDMEPYCYLENDVLTAIPDEYTPGNDLETGFTGAFWRKGRIAKGFKKPKTGFFLRAESFYNVATEIDELGVIDSYGNKSLHEQSHGEAFLALMTNRFGNQGLYILDEPEAALSPNRQMSILSLIHTLVKQGSQFIISTHSPILLSYPGSIIYEIDDNGLQKTTYEETNTYEVSKRFLNNYQMMLDVLLT